MLLALDATYSVGRNLSGVGVYSREILSGLAQAHPEQQFLWCYRPHRFLRSFRESAPANTSRRPLWGAPRADLFHGLNQRMDARAKRTVTTFHDLFVMTGEYSTPEFRARFTQQARAAARNSDRIVAVSEFTANQVEALLGVKRNMIRVIPHGVRVPAEVGSSREKLVLSVGAIQRRKNVVRLVQAFERMPSGWRLILAGSADGFGADEALAAIQQSPRRESIEVAGYVSRELLDSLYRRASIFAFPSLDEGFGIPVLEAMAYGVPVVTSARSALPEVAGDAALLVDPTRVDAIAEALARVADDEDLRHDMSVRGRARAMNFSWDKTIEQTWAVYQELL